MAHAIEARNTARERLARGEKIISGLQQSAYLRAISDHAVVAMVPYDNLGHVAPGTKLYACKLAMVWCHEVGTVLEILPGEVVFRHPHRDSELRGQMIELRLDDATASEADELFAGGSPLGL